MGETIQAWKTPLALIPDQYKLKNITYNGETRSWDDVYESNPNYEIYTDAKGKPINPILKNNIWEDNENRIADSEQGHMNKVNSNISDNERIRNQVTGMLEYVPFIGDGIEGYNIFNNLNKGNYSEAGLGIAGFLLPSFISKSGKYLWKNGGNKLVKEGLSYVNDFTLNLPITINAISKNRYTPFMSKSQYNSYIRSIHNGIDNDVKTFTSDLAMRNYSIRRQRGINEQIDFSKLEPKVYYEHSVYGSNNTLGQYDSNDNSIILRINSGLFPNYSHSLRSKEDILKTGAHEFGHYWSEVFPYVGNLTTPTKKYFGPNKYHPDIKLFKALKSNKPGTWSSSPDEAIADMYAEKWEKGVLDLNQLSEKQYKSVLNKYTSLLGGFWLNKDKATTLINNINNNGFKYGGKIIIK